MANSSPASLSHLFAPPAAGKMFGSTGFDRQADPAKIESWNKQAYTPSKPATAQPNSIATKKDESAVK